MTKPLQTVVRELQRQLITKEQENQDLRKKNTQLQTLNDALVEEHRELFQKAQDCEKEKQQLQNTINNLQNQLAQQQQTKFKTIVAAHSINNSTLENKLPRTFRLFTLELILAKNGIGTTTNN
jgi:predicted  nucleic acid-binding Zn-ribbon protein